MKDIFVSNSESSKPYKVYVPSQWKTILRQDVMIDKEAWTPRSQEPPKEV